MKKESLFYHYVQWQTYTGKLSVEKDEFTWTKKLVQT